MRQINVLTVVALVSVLGLAACDLRFATTSVVPTPVSIIPTATPPPISTATAAPTATETPPPIPTGTPVAPTATPCPAPTPGGPVGRILFSAVPCAEAGIECEIYEGLAANIYLINSDGTGLRQLVKGGGFIGGLSLSPDGRMLAFTDSREDLRYSPYRSHVYVWNISTGAIQPLMADLPDEETEQTPQWFPDSNRLAYVGGLVDSRGTTLGDSPTSLYIVRADGTGRMRVIERPPNSHIHSVAISPDGSQIAFVGLEWDAGLPRYAAYCVNADGSNLRELMVLHPSAHLAGLFWAPDGDHIVVFDRAKGNPTELHILSTLGEETRRIIQVPGYLMGWRWRSNSEIGMVTYDSEIGLFVWALHIYDGNLQNLISTSRKSCGDVYEWSPDGIRIAFADHDPLASPERYGLYIWDVDSGCESQILGEYYVTDLLWLPTGVTIP